MRQDSPGLVRACLAAMALAVVLGSVGCAGQGLSSTGAGTTCLSSPTGGRLEVVNAEPRTADGMPMLGDTTRQRVAAVLDQSRNQILASCRAATDVTMTPGFGKAWTGVNGDAYEVVETNDDWALLITVPSAKFLPIMPASYNGVTVRFRVEPG